MKNLVNLIQFLIKSDNIEVLSDYIFLAFSVSIVIRRLNSLGELFHKDILFITGVYRAKQFNLNTELYIITLIYQIYHQLCIKLFFQEELTLINQVLEFYFTISKIGLIFDIMIITFLPDNCFFFVFILIQTIER